MKRILTIDPGASGGLAYHDIDGIVQTSKMPATINDICDMLREMKVSGISECYIEKVGMHRIGNSASSSVKFSRHCGQLEGILVALDFSIEMITPQKWMKKLGTIPKDKKQRKNYIKEIVQMKYPHLKVTLATSDALGIMYTTTKVI